MRKRNKKYNRITHPGKPNTSNSVGEHVPQDGRVGIAGGKVGVESGVLPMGNLKWKTAKLTLRSIQEIVIAKGKESILHQNIGKGELYI